jgi:hypothetical protein
VTTLQHTLDERYSKFAPSSIVDQVILRTMPSIPSLEDHVKAIDSGNTTTLAIRIKGKAVAAGDYLPRAGTWPSNHQSEK